MKTQDYFNTQQDKLNIHEMNAIRGGFGGGGVTQSVDEDILLHDPDPDDDDDDDDKDD